MATAIPRGLNGGSNGSPRLPSPARPSAAASPPAPQASVDHEQLVVRRGARSGLHAIVAVHSTALGPSLGGVRLWCYPRTIDGVADALRLAQGMTLKAAAARLELGGGKGVICAPAAGLEPQRRRAALLDFGDLVESLDGSYVTAEDVGISPADMVAIAERTDHVTGLPPEHGGSGDPSPFTAIGVEAAMRACCASRFGDPDLGRRRILVLGLGHVGGDLARRLTAAGAELVLSDIAPAKRELADDLGATWIAPDEAATAECDVLSPCALGGTIHAANADRLRCAVVCGAANNQLADDALAGHLAAAGIVYAPDFIANAGGLIHVYREIRGYSEERARELALGIEATVAQVLATAAERAITPLEAARELAHERLDAASREPVPAG